MNRAAAAQGYRGGGLERLLRRSTLHFHIGSVKILKDITKMRFIGESGYTEAELFYRDAKVPCFSFGPGLGNQAHVTNEYIPIKNLQRATKIYEELIRRVCL